MGGNNFNILAKKVSECKPYKKYVIFNKAICFVGMNESTNSSYFHYKYTFLSMW